MKTLQQRILALIALFEGSANGAINVWDEQFLSVGTLHYAVRIGAGYDFLARIQRADPAGFKACLGLDFDRATRQGKAALVEFCRVNVWRQPGRWRGPFQRLAALPAYAQADADACKPYFQDAEVLARRYGLMSERGLAFSMDRCVQQGGSARPYVDRINAALPAAMREENRMGVLAEAYARTANPKYQEVVKARSLTVAQGSSAHSGYPGNVNLERDYGIRLNARWDAQDVPVVFMRTRSSNERWTGDESEVYGGQQITRAWIAGMLVVYPPGSKATLGDLTIEVYPDGALQLTKKGVTGTIGTPKGHPENSSV